MSSRMIDVFAAATRRYPALWNLCDRLTGKTLRIVYYHAVTHASHEYYPGKVGITPAVFTDQVKLLKSKYEIISVREAMDRADQGEPLDRCLAITFDDGFAECYSVVAPILDAEGLTATFFLIENTLDNRDLMWRNKLSCVQQRASPAALENALAKLPGSNGSDGDDLMALSLEWQQSRKDDYANRLWEISGLPPLNDWLEEHKPYVTTGQAKELLAAGFDIGAHSMSHPRCDRLRYDEFEEEVHGSATRLGKRLGHDVTLFSYPFGDRAPLEYEDRLLKRGSIRSLLGIRDSGRNGNDYRRWERQLLESRGSRAIAQLLLGPIKHRVTNRIQRYRH